MTDNRKIEDASTSFEEALDKTGNGLYNILLVMTCALILLAIGVDLFGFSFVVTAACDLHLTVTEKGVLTSLPLVGILLTSYAWGYVSDTRGRRYTLVVPLLIAFVLSCISSFAPHWIILGVLKFLSMCFSCAANSSTYTLVGESCMQRVRSKYMVLITSLIILSPAVGGVIAYPILKLDFETNLSWLGIVFSPWRLLIIVLAIPSGIGAIALSFFHESPKFLFNCGKKEEALEVLREIYALNHRSSKEEFKVHSLTMEEEQVTKPVSLFRAVYEQSASLFRPPFLWRSLQLFYIVAVSYITNNTFLIWLPHIMNSVMLSLAGDSTISGNVCSMIGTKTDFIETNSTILSKAIPDICHRTIEDNVIFTIISSQSLFAFLNFLISFLPNRRKTVLITILCLSSLSGVCLNVTPEPISSVVFFMVFTCTCLGMGILASFFVDFYPTSYRGMVACLSIMVGRSAAFIGVNLVGNLLFNYCQVTFYLWSLLVLSSAVAAWFLPPDEPVVAKNAAI